MSQPSPAPSAARESAGAPSPARGSIAPLAPFLWSVRREVWEHRSLYLAPLSMAGLVLLAALVSALKLGGRLHGDVDLSPDRAVALRMAAFTASAVTVIVVSGVVGFFYCLAALNGERRDRSILFWKSLPVSDLTAVLAKAAVPVVVLPVFVCALVITLQTLLLILGGLGALFRGGDAALMGLDVHLLDLWGLLIYGLAAVSLWYAPIYAWLLMVSAWSKRAPFLWAVLPPLALALVERLMIGTNLVGALLHDRFGGFKVGFRDGSSSFYHPRVVADPAGLVLSPGLWGGLAAAAALIAATVWLRQNRDPV